MKTNVKTVFYCDFCKKLDKLLYPPIAEHKGLPTSYPEQFENQEAMPKECLHVAFVEDIFL